LLPISPTVVATGQAGSSFFVSIIKPPIVTKRLLYNLKVPTFQK